MKKRPFIIGAEIITIFLILGCDNVYSPPRDPRANIEVQQTQEPMGRLPESLENPTKKDLLELYQLLTVNLKELDNWRKKLETMKQKKDPEFATERTRFRKWAKEVGLMMEVKKERFDPKRYPNMPEDHPTIPIWKAIRTFLVLAGIYIEYFYESDKLYPEIEERLNKELAEFREKIKTYEFPQEQEGHPPKIDLKAK